MPRSRNLLSGQLSTIGALSKITKVDDSNQYLLLAAPNGHDDDVSPEKFPEDDYEDNSPTPSTPSQSTTTVDLLASRRAINLARGTAISLNGGLSQYRPGNCMFASAKDNPCITRSDLEGIEFTIPGGPPGWEQKGNKPSVTTVVVVATDGRSVLESRNN
jgi:hypothetical protein